MPSGDHSAQPLVAWSPVIGVAIWKVPQNSTFRPLVMLDRSGITRSLLGAFGLLWWVAVFQMVSVGLLIVMLLVPMLNESAVGFEVVVWSSAHPSPRRTAPVTLRLGSPVTTSVPFVDRYAARSLPLGQLRPAGQEFAIVGVVVSVAPVASVQIFEAPVSVQVAVPFTTVIEPVKVLGSSVSPAATVVVDEALVATLSVKFLQSVTDMDMFN
ncbi:unannotated protein [freshwater metagenome]|uniref:Unannotated protein n=1 Tax=freshwater metagenome TaxID=449393 RepID=A0A6J7U3Y7_9ZZZZ